MIASDLRAIEAEVARVRDTVYERVDVVSDTPAWEAERRRTLGASEVPAMLGLSPYASPLDVYRAKFGVDRPMDPELAFIGHAEEVVIGKWMRAFRPELGVLRRGFMARSVEHPWLHASFDRFVVKRGTWTAVQMKTAHQYASSEWSDDEAPIPVQAQVQAELLVSGAPYQYAVAFIGGRRFHVVRIDRDEEFLREILIPQGLRFWEEHVLAKVPPEPTTSAEAVSLWPGDEGEHIADEETVGLLEQLRTAQATEKAADAEIDRLKLEVQKRMRNASTLLAPGGGHTLATWNRTAGQRRLDTKALRADHPDLADAYTPAPTPGRQFRLKPPKETP